MKALSFLEPWASCVLRHGKVIDNRKRKDGKMPSLCRHRGPLLIHASLGASPRYMAESLAWIAEHVGLDVSGDTFTRGGIVGRCNVIGHVEPTGATRAAPSEGMFYNGPPLPASLDMRWHMVDSYGLILADIEAVPFVPWKGCLGLWDIPDDYAARPAPGGRA